MLNVMLMKKYKTFNFFSIFSVLLYHYNDYICEEMNDKIFCFYR
jgi:hypothetical protein